MTAIPYTADELPGVIEELRATMERWRFHELDSIAVDIDELERLLATVEALAGDAAKHMTHLYCVASNGGFTGTNSPDDEAAEKYLCELLRVDEDGLFDKIQDYAARKDQGNRRVDGG